MYTSYLLISLIQIKSVFLKQLHSPNAYTLYNMESTCGDGGKQSLHLNNPGVFVFNSTVNSSKFSCHLELHLHSKVDNHKHPVLDIIMILTPRRWASPCSSRAWAWPASWTLTARGTTCSLGGTGCSSPPTSGINGGLLFINIFYSNV